MCVRILLMSLLLISSVLLDAVVALAAPKKAKKAKQSVEAPPQAGPHDGAWPVLHGETSEELALRAEALYQQLRALLPRMQQKSAEKKLEVDDMLPLGRAVAASDQLDRVAQQLMLRFEPAGADYQARAWEMRNGFFTIIRDVREDPRLRGVLGKSQSVLATDVKKSAKLIATAEKLANQDQWVEAEAVMMPLADRVTAISVWYADNSLHQIVAPVTMPAAVTVARATAIRQLEGAAALDALRAETVPDFDQLLSEVARAATELAANGKVPFDGQDLSGPQAVEHLHQAWQQTHRRAIQALAIDWAKYPALGSSGIPLSYENCARSFNAGLVKVFEAEAGRTAPEELAQLHHAYLTVAARVALQSADPQVTVLWEESLMRLVSRNPALLTEVAAYRSATAPALAWRARTVHTFQLARQAEEDAASGQIVEPARRSAKQSLGTTHLMLEVRDSDSGKTLFSKPSMSARLIPARLNAKVTLRDLVLLPAETMATPANDSDNDSASAQLVARYQDRCFATTTVAVDTAAALAQLKADLLVGEDAPPLTLAAAMAIESAERGRWACCGGTITTATLEPLIVRMAKLTDADAMAMPAGELPTESTKMPLHEMVWQLTVKPQWACHPYFVMDKLHASR